MARRRERVYMTGGHLVLPIQWSLSSVLLVIGLVAFTLGLLLLTGVCVWPYLIRAALGEGELAASCRSLAVAGGVSLAASLAAALAMAWYDTDYSALKSFACAYLISLFLTALTMLLLGVDLLGASQIGAGDGFLSATVHGVVAVVLAVVPGALSTAAGFILRLVGVMLYGRS